MSWSLSNLFATDYVLFETIYLFKQIGTLKLLLKIEFLNSYENNAKNLSFILEGL